MKIESLKRYQKRHPQERFADLPPHLRVLAEQILQRLRARWRGRLPGWRHAILCGCAKNLALHPRDSAWGRHMLAIQGGRARQRQCQLLGIHPTERATRARLMKQRLRKRDAASARAGVDPRMPPHPRGLNPMAGTPHALTPEQQREQREADAAWLEPRLQDYARWQKRRRSFP